MTHPIRLGCIADDFTGATDLANNLVVLIFTVALLASFAAFAGAIAHLAKPVRDGED